MRTLSKEEQKQRLKPIRDAVSAYRPVLVTTIVFSFVINLLMFTGPLYMLQIYDRVLASQSRETLISLSIIGVFLLAIFGVLEYLRSRILVRAGILFDKVLARPLFDIVAQASLTTPNAQPHRGLRDMDSIREFLTGTGLIAFCDAPWVPLFLVLCFLLHPLLGFVSLAGAIIIFLLALGNELATRDKLAEGAKKSVEANYYAQSTLRNAEVIRAMGMRTSVRERWSDRHDDVLTHQAIASDKAGVFLSFSKFIRMSLQIAILGVGAYLAIIREISPGVMIAASILMGRALQPVEQAVGNWKQFVSARGAYERIKMLVMLVPPQSEYLSLPDPKGTVTFEKVITGAPGSTTPILKGVTFNIPAGEVVGIVGHSAAGKSTLARVMVGVWPVVQGTVRIDGSELHHWNSETLGRFIGYLPQDIELFAGTIAENICRFDTLDDEEIIKASEMAGVHAMIQRLPDGYNTQIGEGGMSLSGGQRQRIGLARALYRQPSLIVLDEPNAHLDTAGEANLIQAIQTLKALGKTVILITHKPSMLTIVDQIIVMENGTIKTAGPRDKIIQIQKPADSLKQDQQHPQLPSKE
jgi:ATP-binding cassette, subfamily C, bacterial